MASNKDTIANEFVSRNDIFADIVNYSLYHGRQKIKPEDLSDLDSREHISWIGDNGKIISKQVFRDVFKQCVFKKSEDCYYMYIGVENQSEVNHAMVIKNMLYDSLNYAAQLRDISRKNRKKYKLKSGEFLSGFRKEDKLIPVVTITMLWNGCEWNGARSLKEILNIPDSKLEPLINDYHLNLIVPIECDKELFNTELKTVIQVLSKMDDKEELFDFIQSDSNFLEIDNDLAKILCEFTNLKKPKEKNGGINMCKAVEDWKREIIEETTVKVTQKVVSVLSQVINGLISVTDAAQELGMSESDISALLQR